MLKSIASKARKSSPRLKSKSMAKSKSKFARPSTNVPTLPASARASLHIDLKGMGADADASDSSSDGHATDVLPADVDKQGPVAGPAADARQEVHRLREENASLSKTVQNMQAKLQRLQAATADRAVDRPSR